MREFVEVEFNLEKPISKKLREQILSYTYSSMPYRIERHHKQTNSIQAESELIEGIYLLLSNSEFGLLIYQICSSIIPDFELNTTCKILETLDFIELKNYSDSYEYLLQNSLSKTIILEKIKLGIKHTYESFLNQPLRVSPYQILHEKCEETVKSFYENKSDNLSGIAFISILNGYNFSLFSTIIRLLSWEYLYDDIKEIEWNKIKLQNLNVLDRDFVNKVADYIFDVMEKVYHGLVDAEIYSGKWENNATEEIDYGFKFNISIPVFIKLIEYYFESPNNYITLNGAQKSALFHFLRDERASAHSIRTGHLSTAKISGLSPKDDAKYNSILKIINSATQDSIKNLKAYPNNKEKS